MRVNLDELRRWRETGERPAVLSVIPVAIAERYLHPADVYGNYVYDPETEMLWPNELWATDDDPTYEASPDERDEAVGE